MDIAFHETMVPVPTAHIAVEMVGQTDEEAARLRELAAAITNGRLTARLDGAPGAAPHILWLEATLG